MRHALLSRTQIELLDRINRAGSVLEFEFFDCADGEDHLSQSEHRTAVVAAMTHILAQFNDLLQFDPKKAENLAGKRIGPKLFLGTRYDWDRRGLIYHCNGKFLFYRDKGTSDDLDRLRNLDSGIGSGLAYAFADPPYNLSIDVYEMGDMFESLLALLLGGLTDETVVFEWPTDWSNYFDAGHEWWGSFLWSIANPKAKRIAVIAASTSD